MHNYTTYEEHVRYVELPQHEHENHQHDKEGTASDVLEPKRKRKQQPAMKKRFDHLLSVAEKLPVMTLPDLIRAIVRPVQSDFLLAVAEEGTDARPNMTPEKFFFEGLIHVKSYEKMKRT